MDHLDCPPTARALCFLTVTFDIKGSLHTLRSWYDLMSRKLECYPRPVEALVSSVRRCRKWAISKTIFTVPLRPLLYICNQTNHTKASSSSSTLHCAALAMAPLPLSCLASSYLPSGKGASYNKSRLALRCPRLYSPSRLRHLLIYSSVQQKALLHTQNLRSSLLEPVTSRSQLSNVSRAFPRSTNIGQTHT